ncbi:hypothetical protein LCGC14_0412210 [marine sediment metagenome]|uniref:Uncharacterized protein n=1 Tax=marine sediment metagenome TaxID=412755 RepID=A0A0F9STK5_9ZZZZ
MADLLTVGDKIEAALAHIRQARCDFDSGRERLLEALDGVKKLQQEPEPPAEPVHRLGDRYTDEGEEYILAQVAPDNCCLISLKDGQPRRPLIEVGNAYKVTQSELQLMTGGWEFTKIDKAGG